jgi:hypothetical protein
MKPELITSITALITSILGTIVALYVNKKQKSIELKKSILDILVKRIEKMENILKQIHIVFPGSQVGNNSKFSDDVLLHVTSHYFEVNNLFKTIEYLFDTASLEKQIAKEFEIAKTFTELKLIAENHDTNGFNREIFIEMIEDMNDHTESIKKILNHELRNLNKKIDKIII